MAKIKLEPNERGFKFGTFKDLYGASASIQESSLATQDAIWFGLDEGTHTATGECMARMHLSREQVQDLIPILEMFAKKGHL